MELLSDGQARVVLARLLDAHPELADAADRLAVGLLAAVDPGTVADHVVSAFQRQPFTVIAQRAGRQPGGGYVHETDAGWELLEQTLQPWRDELDRLAAAGLDQPARRLVSGVIAGLHRLSSQADSESLLGWMDASEAAVELADGFVSTATKAGVVPLHADQAAAAPSWYA